MVAVAQDAKPQPSVRRGCLIAVLLCLVILVWAPILTQALRFSSGPSDTCVCMSNLKCIALGVNMYRSDFGTFPRDLVSLARYFEDLNYLKCAARGNDGLSLRFDYVYRVPVDPDSATEPMAWDSETRHPRAPRGVNVLFANGHVDYVKSMRGVLRMLGHELPESKEK